MNKLLLSQLGLLTASIFLIATCFFLTIVEYKEKGYEVQIQFNMNIKIIQENGIVFPFGTVDCSINKESQKYTQECQSWELNYAMGISVIICACSTLTIVILREFLIRDLASRYAKQVTIGIYALSSLSLLFALIGMIWLLFCQNLYVIKLLPVILMLFAGILNMVGGIIIENSIVKSKGETLLSQYLNNQHCVQQMYKIPMIHKLSLLEDHLQ